MMIKICYILFFIFLISCSGETEENEEITTYTYSPEASLDLYIQGTRFLDQGKYKEAENTFEKLLIIDPDFSKAWEGLADASLMQSKLNQSLDYLNKALEMNPSIVSHYSKKSLVLYYLDDFESSDIFSNLSLEMDNNDVRAMIVLGSIKADKGLFDQSEILFDRALELEPEDSSIYYWKAKSYREYNLDFEKSLELINQAIDLDRSQAVYYIERALSFYAIGDFQNSEIDLLEAIEVAKHPRNQFLIDKAREILEDVKK